MSFTFAPGLRPRQSQDRDTPPHPQFDPRIRPLLPKTGPDDLRRNADLTHSTAPDQAAQDQRLSRDMGLGVDVVSRNRDEVQRRADTQDILSQTSEYPGTRSFLADRDNFAVAKDDVSVLTAIEHLIKENTIDPAKSVYKQAARAPFNLGATAYDAIGGTFGLLDAAERSVGGILHTGSTGVFGHVRDWAMKHSQGLVDTANSFEILKLPEDLRDKGLFDNPGLLLDPEWLAYNVGEAATSMVPQVLLALYTEGGTLYGTALGGLQEGGNLYRELLHDGVDPDRALAASQAFGLVVGALNKLGLDSILGKTATKNLATRAAKSLSSGTVEAVTEWLEEPFQALFGGMARGESPEELGRNVVESFKNIDVMPGAFLLGGGTAFATQYRAEHKSVKAAEHDQAFFEALDQNSAASKTRQRMPEAYERAVEAIQQEVGGPVRNIYIDAELFQAALPAEQLSEVLESLDAAEQFDEAITSGGDIVIPLSKYATYIAGTDISAQLRPDIRFRQEGMSAREAEAWQKKWSEDLETQVTAVREQKEVADQFETERQQVYEDILAKRQSAGVMLETAKSDAETWAAFASTWARRYDSTPAEVYAQMTPEIRSEKFSESGLRVDEVMQRAAADPETAAQVEKLGEESQLGLEQNPETGDIEFHPVKAALGIAQGDQTLYQGIENPVDGRFLRGQAPSKDNARVVVGLLKEDDILNQWDGVSNMEDALARAEDIKWLDPIVVTSAKGAKDFPGFDKKNANKKLRWGKKKAKGYEDLGNYFYGNDKMQFPSFSYPRGRNTWDIPGCGREAWAIANGIDITQACYGGACYAESLVKLNQGKIASVAEGVRVVSDLGQGNKKANTKLREEMNAFFEGNGLEATQKKWPEYQIKVNDTKGSKNFGKLSIAQVFSVPSAVVSTKLQSAKGVDIRLGVDTDGAAWLANPEVMDAILKADPRTLSVYSSAYHNPPAPHALAGRTIINVTVSGWHPLPETLARIRWAEEARKNGWNVILREVVANPEQFDNATAKQYNRLHDALLETDFFLMQQPLHIGATHGEPMWKLPSCCVGSEKNLHTCDQCEVSEGLGKKFQEYWKIHEEKDKEGEIVLPDSEYEGRTMYQQAQPFYSQLSQSIEALQQETAPASQWQGMIKKLPIKQEELEWSGVAEWLDVQKGKVNKQEILDYVAANNVQVEEVVKGVRYNADLTGQRTETFDTLEEAEEALTGEREWIELESATIVDYEDEIIVSTHEDGVVSYLYDGEEGVWEKTILTGYGQSEVEATFSDKEDALSDAEDEAQKIRDVWHEEISEEPYVDESGGNAKFSDHQLPGGENYKELLLTLPIRESAEKNFREYKRELKKKYSLRSADFNGREWQESDITVGEINKLSSLQEEYFQEREKRDKSYRSSHFDEPNILAHIRFNERTDADGNNVLFLEEVQSDWHQEGRREGYQQKSREFKIEEVTVKEIPKIVLIGGTVEEHIDYWAEKGREITPDSPAWVTYQDGDITSSNIIGLEAAEEYARNRAAEQDRILGERGVPDAPFKKTWPLLALKRMVRYAAENGFDKVAWATGEQQADRYDLSKQVDAIGYAKNSDGTYEIQAFQGDMDSEYHPVVTEKSVTEDKLETIVGKDLAEKIIKGEGQQDGDLRIFEGQDLKVGGEGMKSFYDKMLPSMANKFFKKFGGKVEVSNLGETKDAYGVEPFTDDLGKTAYRVIALHSGAQIEVFAKKDLAEKHAWKLNNATNESRAKNAGVIGRQHSLAITPQMKEAALGQGFPLFQNASKDPQGSFTTRDGKPLIRLFERANASTFLHESGHVFFTFMSEQAQQPHAPEALRDDWQSVLKYVGNDGTSPLTTEQHEKLARSLEAYFMEGKSPSPKLRKVFQQFADWLKALYRQISQLNAPINDDIRPIFDRMFATEQEIEEAKYFYDAQKPFFADQEIADEKERKKYKRLQADADLDAADKRLKKYAKAYVRALGGEKEIKKQVAEEVNVLPVYAAVEKAIAEGGMFIGDVEALIGEDARKQLAKKRVGLVTTKGELNPETLAAENGFANASLMLQAMLQAEKKSTLQKQMFEKEMQRIQQNINEGYENSPQDTGAQGPAADDEYHSNARMAVLIAEVQLLQQRKNLEKGREKATARRLETQAVRDVARQVLQSKTVSDAISHYKYSRAEAKAARQAREAYAAGNTEKAERYKRRELLNHALVLEAVKARETISKGISFTRTVSRSKSVRPDSLDQIRDLAARFGLMGKRPGEALADTVSRIRSEQTEWKSLSQWAEAMDELGYPSLFDDLVVSEVSKDYRELTFDEFTTVVDAIKTIQGIDRQERYYLSAEEAKLLEEVEDELLARLESTHKAKPLKKLERNKLKETLAGANAVHTKIEFLLKKLDGSDSLGPWWTYFFKPLSDAENERAAKLKAATERIQGEKLFGRYSARERGRMFSKKILIPEIQDAMTKSQILAVALNMGNFDNYQKLMEGYGWNEAQMAAIVGHLDQQDWDFVQAVWDYLDTFRPESFQLQKDITGRTPKKVKAQPVETKFGTYRGGYYPLVFDSRISHRAFQREQKEMDKYLFGGRNYGAASTKHGHLKERKQSAGGQAVNLDLATISDHVFNVIHDITHRRAVLDVAKLVRSDRLRQALEATVGIEMSRELMPWLQDVAREYQEPMHGLHRFAKWARGGTTIMNMGLKATTAAVQPIGYTQTIDQLGAAQAAKGLNMFYGSGNGHADLGDRIGFVLGKSKFMANRLRSFDRDIRDATKGLTPGKQLSADVKRFAFLHIGLVQMGVDMPTWYAAYDKGLKDLEDDQKAVDYADSMVRITQGAGGTKDLSRIQRGGELQRLFTMFYSYFNTLYNLASKRFSETKKITDVPALAASAMWLWFTPALLSELIAGRGPEEDETWGEWAWPTLVMYPFQTVVAVRDMANYAFGEFGYQITPAQSAPKELVDWFKTVAKAIEKDDHSKVTKQTAETLGYIFHWPMKQIIITVGNIYDYATGEDPEFEIRDIFYRKRR